METEYSQFFIFISNKIRTRGKYKQASGAFIGFWRNCFPETSNTSRQFHFWNVASNSMNSNVQEMKREREREDVVRIPSRMNVTFPDFHEFSTAFSMNDTNHKSRFVKCQDRINAISNYKFVKTIILIQSKKKIIRIMEEQVDEISFLK